MNRFIKPILDAAYPLRCIYCGEIIHGDTDSCDYCSRHIKRIDTKNRCKLCGREIESCCCDKYRYHFKELSAVFKYEGDARDALYRFKYFGKRSIASVFASFMAENINENFTDVSFDFVCYVPTDRKTVIIRSYDHAYLLASELSHILKLPLINALSVGKIKAKQHENSYKERLKSVRGKYKCRLNLSGKTVLLVDDIATTGATLDSCARELLFSGADTVYAATVFATEIKKYYDTF